MIKTIKQYERDRKKCKLCKGTGQDPFDKVKPCPNCSANVEVLIPKNEEQQMFEEELRFEHMMNCADQEKERLNI